MVLVLQQREGAPGFFSGNGIAARWHVECLAELEKEDPDDTAQSEWN